MANWIDRAHARLHDQPAPELQEPKRFSWILYRRGQPPIEVRFLPEVTKHEAEARYPGARALEVDV